MIKSGIDIFQSRGSLAVNAGIKQTNDHAEPTTVERYKSNRRIQFLITNLL